MYILDCYFLLCFVVRRNHRRKKICKIMEKNVELVIENPISVDQIEKGVYLGNVTAGK